MRCSVSGSVTFSPLRESKYSKPRPRPRRTMPGPEQSLRRRRVMGYHLPRPVCFPQEASDMRTDLPILGGD